MARKTVYEATTDMFIRKCEERRAAGNVVAPWKMTWDPALGQPRNFVSGKPYRGVNMFFTMLSGYSSPFWLTRKQIKTLGGTIKDGAEYTPITFWWFPNPHKPEEQGRPPFVKFYQAFNAEQVDGIQDKVNAKLDAIEGRESNANPIESAQAIVDGWAGKPAIAHGGGRCCYIPSFDQVEMPPMQAFESGEAYYRSLFHELTHSTGARKRLNRDGVANPAKFGSHAYSEEELVAEMGSAMLAGFAGIASPEADDNSAAYLDHWLKVLKGEPKMLEMAGRAAQKAVDMIRGTSFKKE